MKEQLEKIRELEPKAAEYIEKTVVNNYGGFQKLNSDYELLDHFIWSLTPQGNDYWYKIWQVLND